MSQRPSNQAHFKVPASIAGERDYFSLEPARTPRHEPATVSGSRHANARAFLFSYPFDIHVDGGFAPAYDFQVNKQRHRLYAPFLNSDDPDGTTTQVPPERIPYAPGTVPPTADKLFYSDVSLNRPLGRRTNAFRLDLPVNTNESDAEAVADRLIGIVRWWTGQWWIKRDRRHVDSPLKNFFTVNELGERIDGIRSCFTSYGFLGFEKPLTSNSLADVLKVFAQGREIPLSRDTYCDAIYFHSIGDVRRAIIEVAIAAEALLSETVQRLRQSGAISATQSKRLFQGNDFMKHLSRLGELCRNTFESRHAREYAALRSIWIARGHLAHGKPVDLPSGVTSSTMTSVFMSFGVYDKWLSQL